MLGDLDEAALVQILTEPKNSLLKQYQQSFEYENIKLKIEPAALKAIAKRALDRKVGARGLRMIMEELMLDLMFELPDLPKGGKFVVDESMVKSGSTGFTMPESKSAYLV